MAVDFQASPFEPLTVYDAPSVLFKMLLNGQVTAKGLQGALFDPAMLSPSERETMSSQIKKASGYNPVVGALSDVALNPWVWLAFAISPAAAGAIQKGGRLFAPAERLLFTVNHDPPGLMYRLGLATSFNWLDRAGLGSESAFAVGRTADRLRAEFDGPVMDALNRMAKSNGLKNGLDLLDPRVMRGGPQYDRARDAMYLYFAALEGLDRTRRIAGVEVAPWVANRDAFWAKIRTFDGLEEAITATQDAFQQRKKLLFGKEAVEGFEIDPAKITRLYRGLYQNQLFGGEGAYRDQRILGQLKGILGADIVENAATMGEDEFSKLVAARVNEELPTFYFPRNVVDVGTPTAEGGGFSVARGRVRPSMYSTVKRMAPDPSTIQRQAVTPFWHPEDLANLYDLVGGNENMAKVLLDSEAKFQNAARAGRGVRVFRINPLQSLERYSRNTAVTYALHLEELGGKEMDAVEEAIRNNVLRETHSGIPNSWGEGRGALNESWRTIKGPAGGFTRADVLKTAYAFQQNEYSRKFFEQVLVPIMTDSAGPGWAALHGTTINGKAAMNAFAKSWAGQAVRKTGDLGAGFIRRLEELSDPDIPVEYGRTDKDVASYFYSTTLGLNLSSAMLNMMQPFSYAATWLGAGPVLRGYAKAVPELLGYLWERVNKYGIKPITEAQRAGLASKHFKFADLAGIGPSVLDQIDREVLAAGNVGRPLRWIDKLNDAALSIFSKAEWLNRSVTAHAVESVMRKRGGVVDPQELAYNVSRMVGATQFATTSPLERPLIFQPGGEAIHPFGQWLQSPLTRQFGSFVLRSFSGLGLTGTAIAGREGGAKTIMADFARGMGVAAVVHELSKNLAGVDLSRGLFFSSVTEALPGMSQGRYSSQDTPLFTPPIFDIPLTAIKAIGDPNITLLGNVAPRMIPLGVAFSRALGVQRSIYGMTGSSVLASAQRTYVDWSRPAMNGMYPVFKSDGTLMGYESGTALVLKGLGADLSGFRDMGELDNWLVKNRDQIVDYRRRYLQAVVSNNIDDSHRIAAEYQTRFKLPLTVTKEQVQQMQQNRMTSRSERAVDRLPPDIRDRYSAIVDASRPQTPSSQPAPQMTPEQVKELMRTEVKRQQVGGGPQGGANAFPPFQSY